MAKVFRIKLIKSTIGCTESQIRTVESLGLRRIGNVVVIADNRANRGQVLKVQHLVDVKAESAK